MATRHHDLIIIGSGSGNSILGPEFDALDVAICEDGVFGGTCLNVGCIPTKMFVYPADIAYAATHEDHLGVSFGQPEVDWPSIRDRVFGRIDPISAGGEDYRSRNENVTLYRGTARFVGPKTLDTGTGQTITADRIVIAAGGRARGLDIPGLEGDDPANNVHTNASIMRIDELPERLAVIGGGFIAAEFAHVFDAVGARVSWIHHGEQILRHEDETISAAYTALATDRHDVRLSTTVTGARRTGVGWTLTCKGPEGESELEVDRVLLAVGRVPNTDRLDVAAAGIALHEDGRVVVDEYQQTSEPGVFALGDISSDWQLKHVANREAKTVKHNLAHPEAMIATDHRFVPHAVFTNPQIAGFGKTERELKDAGVDYVVKTQAYGDVAYGWAMEDRTGIVKVLADRSTHLILGAHIMGYQSAILVQLLIQAAQFDQTTDEIAKAPYWIHPALSEVIENALLGLDYS